MSEIVDRSDAAEPGSEEWHNTRRLAVGGSDLGKLFGVYSFDDCTATAVWEYKTGRSKGTPPSPAAQRGTRLEPVVLAKMQELMGLELREGKAFVRPKDWPNTRFQANTDGEFVWGDRPGLAEAKTGKVSYHAKSSCKLFRSNICPEGYALQCVAYMDLLDYEWGIIGCAIGPREHENWTAEDITEWHLLSMRHNRRAAEMIWSAIQDFWEFVDKDTKPTWDVHPNSSRILAEINKTPVRRARTVY